MALKGINRKSTFVFGGSAREHSHVFSIRFRAHTFELLEWIRLETPPRLLVSI